MATFGWSYRSNVSGSKRPKELKRKIEDWQKDREDVKISLHRQTHSAESVNAGLKRRRYHPRAKIFVGNLNKDTKPITLAEYFSFFGEISYMKMIKDKETGLSRGFAFITFVEVDEAEKAVRWCRGNHPRVDGKEIRVGFAERRFGPARKHASLLACSDTSTGMSDSHTLHWEFKWSENPQSEVYGPYKTSMMLQWYNMGYFNDGCWVRQVHHITTNHGPTQELQLADKNLPMVPSLVDAYSSSSDDEEIENTKNSAMHDNLESEERRQNNESKNKQSDGLKKEINEKLLDKAIEKEETINDTKEKEDLFQIKSVQSIVENRTEATNQINESLSHDNKSKSNSVSDKNKSLMQNENTKQGNGEMEHLPTVNLENNAPDNTRTNKSNTQLRDSPRHGDDKNVVKNKQANEQTQLLQHIVDSNQTKSEDIIQEGTESGYYMHTSRPHQTQLDENTKCTSEEVTKKYCSDDEREVLHDNQGGDEMTQPCYKDKDGCRIKDMLGRDSSSEDEDYEDYDQPLSDNDFVHISEIDFSMFP